MCRLEDMLETGGLTAHKMNTLPHCPAGKALVRRFAVYGVIPLVLSIALIGMYFSGISWLQQVVSPAFPGLYPDSNRELGLLENLQNVFLAVIVYTCLRGAWRKESVRERVFWGAAACFSLFVLLEEMDYGLHLYELLRGVSMTEAATTRNIHNTYDLTDIMKNGSLVGMILLFVVLPFGFVRSSSALIRYTAPDKFSALTLVVMFLVRTLAHWLNDRGFGAGGTIHKNISEFRELLIYYLFMVYFLEVVFRRMLHPEAPGRGCGGKDLEAA